ncbi:MAG: RNA polymerase factor sigma-54 [Candidatus Aphodosoma sp.]
MAKTGIVTSQTQKLTTKITPQQIQIIKFIETPVAELESLINKELEENPALDLNNSDEEHFDEEFPQENNSESDDDWKDIDSEGEKLDFNLSEDDNDFDYDYDGVGSYHRNADNETDDYMSNISSQPSLRDFLLDQLGTANLSSKQFDLCRYVVDNIDENGFLNRTAEQMRDDIAITEGYLVSENEVDEAVNIVRHLDPIGVASYSLQDCLAIQLDVMKENDPDNRFVNLALQIVNKYLPLIETNKFNTLSNHLNCSRNDIEKAVEIIKSLNAKPGANYSVGVESIARTITPDFQIVDVDGKPKVLLNSNFLPKLRVDGKYMEMLDYLKGSDLDDVKKYVDKANNFIVALQQRNPTLNTIMNAIVDYQYDYFMSGGDDAKLKPMRLKDISEKTGFDESIISRVNNNKYVDTAWGVIPLKHFFVDGMENTDGVEVSKNEIRYVLKSIIDNEDKSHPLTDDEIVVILKNKGYNIARRTVAKYRAILSIPTAKERMIL